MYECLSILNAGKKRKMEVDLTDGEADGVRHLTYSSRMSEKFFNSEPSDW